jgi:hypothetical protein
MVPRPPASQGRFASTDCAPHGSSGSLSGENLHPFGRLAQLVEQLFYMQHVGGSSPSPATISTVAQFMKSAGVFALGLSATCARRGPWA